MLDELHSRWRQGFGGGFYEQKENKCAPSPANTGNYMYETKNDEIED
jgi:hypothetical protein